ncbi:intracellular growth attenuator family protein [Methylobacter tundripaludum]|nr:intracellular growth attenuator family protein [Methylobacter tundripaludum]
MLTGDASTMKPVPSTFIRRLKMLFTDPAAIIILIGTITAALGALWAADSQNESTNELKAMQEKINTRNEEIIKLNREIGNLSHHTMNMVTGGNSYAYILFSNNESESVENMQLGNIFLIHEGQYPLYDLTIQITDIDTFKNEKIINVGNIGSIQHIKHWPLNYAINFNLHGKSSQRFNIFFYARNGTWYQQLIYKKLKSKWYVATRVVRSNEQGSVDVLFKDISPNFPIHEQDIIWQ